MRYEKKFAWSWLLRLYHWAMALSVLVLALTGLYINHPVTSSLTGGGHFPMADMRYIHFITAFIFSGAIIARIYLALCGNRQESLCSYIRHLPANIADAWHALLGYLYVEKYRHEGLGHNGLAMISYCITIVIALSQIISGFYLLYPESAFWQSWGLAIFGPQQMARYVHHLGMWYFAIFALVHIYIVIWNEIRQAEGMLSSMLGGYKFKPRKAQG
jgi:Ni/Fe-hydrogenase 1 B-type cytochrome subunit